MRPLIRSVYAKCLHFAWWRHFSGHTKFDLGNDLGGGPCKHLWAPWKISVHQLLGLATFCVQLLVGTLQYFVGTVGQLVGASLVGSLNS